MPMGEFAPVSSQMSVGYVGSRERFGERRKPTGDDDDFVL
jgi:hypothetical protein